MQSLRAQNTRISCMLSCQTGSLRNQQPEFELPGISGEASIFHRQELATELDFCDSYIVVKYKLENQLN
jgi:hypothetical protein